MAQIKPSISEPPHSNLCFRHTCDPWPHYVSRLAIFGFAAFCLAWAVPNIVVAMDPNRLLALNTVSRNVDIDKSISSVRESAGLLKKLGEQQDPKLPAKARQEQENYNKWLLQASDKLQRFADQWQARVKNQTVQDEAGSQALVKNYQSALQELTSAMQQENRSFTLISNVMKTKHDTAKNAINNLR